MNNPLRVLILDDSAADAELSINALRKGGFDPEWQRVESESDFLAALETLPDLVLVDYSRPHFNGLSALKLLRERRMDIPLIVISGALGEEAVAEVMKQGAADYLNKDRLARLGRAVSQALELRELRISSRQANGFLRESEGRFRSVLENSKDCIYRLNLQTGRFEYISPAAEKMSGYSLEELASMDVKTATAMIHPGDLPAFGEALDRLEETGEKEVDYRLRTKSGDYLWVSNSMSLIRDGDSQPLYRDGIIHNVTERKQAEAELRHHEQLLRDVIDGISSPIYLKDLDGKFITINAALERMLGMSREELRGKTDYDIASKELADYWRAHDQKVMAGGKAIQIEEVADLPDGHHFFLADKFPLVNARGELYGIGAISFDITERKQAEAELNLLHRAQKALSDSNRALLHARNETELLNEVCQIIVKDCAHTMVWIGYAEDDEAQTVRPMASAGFDNGYIERLGISWADTEHGRGPTGSAIRSRKPCHCSDMLMDPQFAPWRDEALKRGYASCLALPLLDDGKAFGSVSIYSRLPAGFSGQEVKLLDNLSRDLAFGITTIRLREAQRADEEALRRSELYARNQFAEAEAALEAFPANIAILDAKGVILRVNSAWQAFASQNGGNANSSAPGVNYLDVCDAVTGEETEQAGYFASGIRSVIRRESGCFSMEHPCHSPDEQRWFMGLVTPISGDGPARAVVAHVDITRQKHIEAKIRSLNQELESRVVERTAQLRVTVEELEAEIAARCRLEREILEISEREQRRFGQDLHDGLSQELAGMALIGDVLAKRLVADSNPHSKIATDLASQTRGTIDSARLLAKGLYPVEIDRFGLLLALEDLAHRTVQRFGIACELQQCGESPKLEKTAEIHIFRIVQESIGNAMKHGQAKHIIIESQKSEDGHIFAITDDGIGFEKSTSHPGMGLHLMEYRARVIGGGITVEKPDNGGCRIVCRIPATPTIV